VLTALAALTKDLRDTLYDLLAWGIADSMVGIPLFNQRSFS